MTECRNPDCVDPNHRLARIEAKLDALMEWSPWQDAQGRLIPQREYVEKARRDREGWPDRG